MARNTIINDRKDYFFYVILVIIALSFTYFYFNAKSNPVADVISRDQDLISAFVIHDNDEVLITDVYIYNPKNKRASLFDIPGNVGHVFDDKKLLTRIDSYFNKNNPLDYLKTISRLLGLEAIPFYFIFDKKELSRIIDLLGGVEVFLPNNITVVHDDTGESSALPSGLVVLDGQTVWTYLYTEKGMEDSKIYTDRRQKFMQAFLKQISIKNVLIANYKVKRFIQDNLDSNLQGSSFDLFFQEMALLDADSMVLQRIVGSSRVIDNQPLLFPYYEGKLVKETVKQTLESLDNSTVVMVDMWPSKIEIQNGTNRNGLAISTQRIYESMGFTISKVGNATTEVSYTVVLDLSGRIEVAKKVADVIKCNRVYSVEKTGDVALDSMADVQIILGKDFDGRYAQQISITE